MLPGAAEILTTTSGETPRSYRVYIEKVNDADPHRNMVLRVTDPALLAQTGGIVQGMSGSPILQNGRLVGAVTHVLVNDRHEATVFLHKPCWNRHIPCPERTQQHKKV